MEFRFTFHLIPFSTLYFVECEQFRSERVPYKSAAKGGKKSAGQDNAPAARDKAHRNGTQGKDNAKEQ